VCAANVGFIALNFESTAGYGGLLLHSANQHCGLVFQQRLGDS